MTSAPHPIGALASFTSLSLDSFAVTLPPNLIFLCIFTSFFLLSQWKYVNLFFLWLNCYVCSIHCYFLTSSIKLFSQQSPLSLMLASLCLFTVFFRPSYRHAQDSQSLLGSFSFSAEVWPDSQHRSDLSSACSQWEVPEHSTLSLVAWNSQYILYPN